MTLALISEWKSLKLWRKLGIFGWPSSIAIQNYSSILYSIDIFSVSVERCKFILITYLMYCKTTLDSVFIVSKYISTDNHYHIVCHHYHIVCQHQNHPILYKNTNSLKKTVCVAPILQLFWINLSLSIINYLIQACIYEGALSCLFCISVSFGIFGTLLRSVYFKMCLLAVWSALWSFSGPIKAQIAFKSFIIFLFNGIIFLSHYFSHISMSSVLLLVLCMPICIRMNF